MFLSTRLLVFVIYGWSTVQCDQYIDRSVSDDETMLTGDDFSHLINKKSFDKVAKNRKQKIQKAMLNPLLFEGDIANIGLTAETIHDFLGANIPRDYKKNKKGKEKNAIRARYRRWPNASHIPYAISRQYMPEARQVIADAINQFHINSCIRFVPRKLEKDYIFITPRNGCFSSVGKESQVPSNIYSAGRQIVSLGDGCLFERGTAMHELMHVVGFFHEQSRPDRDKYISIKWDNIMPSQSDQFKTYSSTYMDTLGMPYDYDSIMHYGKYTFSIGWSIPTIVPKKKNIKIGGKQHFSPIDIRELNIVGKCSTYIDMIEADDAISIASKKYAECKDYDEEMCTNFTSKGYCELKNYESLLTVMCPKSCGKCNEDNRPVCVDLSTDCKKWKEIKFCWNNWYGSLRRFYCAKTCGYC